MSSSSSAGRGLRRGHPRSVLELILATLLGVRRPALPLTDPPRHVRVVGVLPRLYDQDREPPK